MEKVDRRNNNILLESKIENNENEEDDNEITSVGLKATNYSNIIERYYTKIYIQVASQSNPTSAHTTPPTGKSEQYYFLHSNGVTLCGLSKNHFLFNENVKIKKIEDLNKVFKVSGKKKHGARVLNEVDYCLDIYYTEKENEVEKEKVFKFSPNLKSAKLMEINQNIIENPEILIQSPEKFGYCCLVYLDNIQAESLKKKHIVSEK